MISSTRSLTLVFLAAVFAILACMAGPAQARMIDGIVAVVDNRIILDSDLRRKMDELGAPLDSREAERQVLELMVEDIVIEKIYKSFGIPPVNEADAKNASEQMKCSVQTARNYLMKGTLMDMMVRSRVVVTENMIKTYYDSRPEYRGKESIRLEQLVVTGDDGKMGKAVDELRAGTPFGEAAKKYSEALSSGSPDIGWIPVEDLSEELTVLLAKAKAGETVGPVASDGGRKTLYHVVEKKVVGTKTLDDARGDIQKTLERKYQQEAFTYWLHKMMTQYFIGIYI